MSYIHFSLMSETKKGSRSKVSSETGSEEEFERLPINLYCNLYLDVYLTLYQQVVFQKLELQESPLLPTKVVVWPVTGGGGN